MISSTARDAARQRGALAPLLIALICLGVTACGPRLARPPGATDTPTHPPAMQTAIAVTGTAIAATQTVVAATQSVEIGPILTSIARTQTAVVGTQMPIIQPTPSPPAVPQTPLALLLTQPTSAAATANVTRTLPDTGFAPGVHTVLSSRSTSSPYQNLQDLWLEIPRLGVRSPIVAVPPSVNGWDVSRLSSEIGWLEGTAFPTWAGNSVMTAHLYDASGSPGPFVALSLLSHGDQFVVDAWGQQYLYEVRSTSIVNPDAVAATLAHEDLAWITLITCKEFDPKTHSYKYRTVIKALQVQVH